ncbi:MAG TPA: nicotinate phosphoribosyltransferase, partial [Roseiflexaceae bacterium]|nr:nicotinate phosphoribosyltransferase [Roseiflexaceae bacterium]
TPAKIPNPGQKQVWRIYDRRGKATADLLSLHDEDPRQMSQILLHHPVEPTKRRLLRPDDYTNIEPLQVTVLDAGRQVYRMPTIDEMRAQRDADLARLDSGIKRLVNPHIYHVSLTSRLWDLKQALIEQTREAQP